MIFIGKILELKITYLYHPFSGCHRFVDLCLHERVQELWWLSS